MNVLRILGFAGLCLAAAVSVKAQTDTPAEVAAAFSRASGDQLMQLSRQFDIKDELRGYICDDLLSPVVTDLMHDSGDMVYAVKLTSPGCRLSFLLMYWKLQDHWLYGGTIHLNERYGDHPHYEAKHLISDLPPVVVVHDNFIASGLGSQQVNMQIFMLVSGKMRMIFDEPLHASLVAPRPGSKRGSFSQIQNSSFQFCRPEESEKGMRVIQEKRVMIVDGRHYTEYYAYGWNPRLVTLSVYPYVPF